MRDKKAFTLVELLIVVVIIGILAGIAIPKFSSTREKAYFSAMKSDLKNLSTQQEIYHHNNFSYTTVGSDLQYEMSRGITVSSAAGISGWSASVVHAALGTSEGCVVFYGAASSPSAPTTATNPGEVACTR